MRVRKNLRAIAAASEEINWQKATKKYIHRNRPAMSPHSMTIKTDYCPIKRTSGVLSAEKLIVRLGAELMKELGWSVGDYILPMFNPDDHTVFLLVKCNKSGYKIKIDKKGSMDVRFPWEGGFPLNKTTAIEVPFELVNNKLIFQLDDSQIK